jgi:hypothetical protein
VLPAAKSEATLERYAGFTNLTRISIGTAVIISFWRLAGIDIASVTVGFAAIGATVIAPMRD